MPGRTDRAFLQIGGLHGELNLPERVGHLFGQCLKPGQCLGRLVLLGERQGNLLLNPRVVGKERFEPAPDLESLVVFLGPLVDPS